MTVPALELALVPRDGFFVKDGRGWHTSASGRGHSLDWPFPSTVLGALRTALGRIRETAASGGRFDGPGFRQATADVSIGALLPLRRPHARPRWAAGDRMWPVPADAMYVRGQATIEPLVLAKPRAPTLGRDEDPAREALWTPVARMDGKPAPRPRWWTDGELLAWLAGNGIRQRDEREHDALTLQRRTDIHLSIAASTQTAQDGMLFASDTMEPFSAGEDRTWEWALGLQASLPAGTGVDHVPWTFGGDRRIARPEPIEGVFEPPKEGLGAAQGLRLVVVTPALFERGWLPDGFEARDGVYRGKLPWLAGELELRAALVPRPIHVSGWDMAAGQPKPTRSLVPPGAVYFFVRTSGVAFSADELGASWLAAIGGGTNEGLGRVVAGRWDVQRGHEG